MDQKQLEGGRILKHVTIEQCRHYILGQLSDHDQQTFEDHIYTCDQCLSMYMTTIEQHSMTLPHISDEAQFTDDTMDLLLEETLPSKVMSITSKPRTKRWYENTIAYYTIAAGITIFLMSTGVFDSLMQLTNITKTERQTSLSDTLMNKTVSMIDVIEKNNKGGNVDE